MTTIRVPDFPVGHDVCYDALSGEWVGHWPEADPRFYRPAHPSCGQRFLRVTDTGLVDDSDPRCHGWVSLRGMLTGTQSMRRRLRSTSEPDQAILPWSRLFPEEDLFALRDPPRYSVDVLLANELKAAVAAGAANVYREKPRTSPYRRVQAILDAVYAKQEQEHAKAVKLRLAFGKCRVGAPELDADLVRGCIQSVRSSSYASDMFHLFYTRCIGRGCEYHVSAFPSARASCDGLCPWCSIEELSLRVCCSKAVPQLRPALPRSALRAFFGEPGCTGEWCDATLDLAEFDAYQALRYNFTCRPECVSKFQFGPFRDIFASMPGAPPLRLGGSPCPASVTEIVCGYLGRRTLAFLLSPLFAYTCVDHPSALDALPYDGAACSMGTPDRRLRRMANVSHYYHVLSAFCLGHLARVETLVRLAQHVRDGLMRVMATLNTPMDPLAPNHAASHRLRLESWHYLYRAYHFPSEFLAAEYDRCIGSGAAAVWTQRNWHSAVSSMCIETTTSQVLGPLEIWYRVPIMTRWPATEWKQGPVAANLAVMGYTCHFKMLYGMAASSGPACEHSCSPDFFSAAVADWVEAVCASPRRSRKRERRHSLSAHPWTMTPETTRSYRHLIPYATESDSDETEPSYSPTPHPNYHTGDTTEDEMPAPEPFSPTPYPHEDTDIE